MLPAAPGTISDSISQSAVTRVLPHECDAPVLWAQRHISSLPDEALSHIFDFLGCDDIARVYDTCQLFRRVVQLANKEAFFFSRLPRLFRQYYPHSVPWQKRVVGNGQHPFVSHLPLKIRVEHHEEQDAAIVCFHTLGKMQSFSSYPTVEGFASPFPIPDLTIDFSQNSSKLLLYNRLSASMIALGQDAKGAWEEQNIVVHDHPTYISDMFFSADEQYLFVIGRFNRRIDILKRDSDRWEWLDGQVVGSVRNVVISSSGQYLVNYTGVIDSIRYFDKKTERWRVMPMSRRLKDKTRIQHVTFSPSERHLAVEYKMKMVMLSLTPQGWWTPSWKTDGRRRVSYVDFCPSKDWLLIGYFASEQDFLGAVEIIRLGPDGSFLHKQFVARRYLKLTFSPAGNYVVSRMGEDEYLLFRFNHTGRLVLYGDLTGHRAPPAKWPTHGSRNLKQDTIVFSACDHYLLTSYRDGTVCIWGQDKQENWTILGSGKHDGTVNHVEFSQSGIHALTVDHCSLQIWGRCDDGSWSVKGRICVDGIRNAHFHPVVEHLIVTYDSITVRIWELSIDDQG